MIFPEKNKAREDYIFNCVLAGTFEAKWVDIIYSIAGKNIRLQVMEDALKIDNIRVNVSANLQQKLADIFDASLMTAQVADLVYTLAFRHIFPAPMQISTTTTSMLKHSSTIDKRLKALSIQEGLIATVGKHWILDKKLERRPDRACNYGWHFTGNSYQGIQGYPVASKINIINGKTVRVIQPNATAHDSSHSDYSQICQLVSQTCWVDGIQKRFSELLVDPVLSTLISHQGSLKFVRQPGVPEVKGTIVLFPTLL